MISFSPRRFLITFLVFVLFAAATLAALALPSAAQTQKAEHKPAQAAPPAAQSEEPRYREYRGVRLGMTAAEVRVALGTPKESEGRQEFYALSDTEMAQVFYDARRSVWAVTVSYLGGQGKAPTPEQIFGGPVEVKPDGSIYKMVKYERAGCYVAYSRDAGDAPFVTVVMQKLPD
jgi:outer membrane protein assembly factor BamE (lipoprotein component of BamABCDE complex)